MLGGDGHPIAVGHQRVRQVDAHISSITVAEDDPVHAGRWRRNGNVSAEPNHAFPGSQGGQFRERRGAIAQLDTVAIERQIHGSEDAADELLLLACRDGPITVAIDLRNERFRDRHAWRDVEFERKAIRFYSNARRLEAFVQPVRGNAGGSGGDREENDGRTIPAAPLKSLQAGLKPLEPGLKRRPTGEQTSPRSRWSDPGKSCGYDRRCPAAHTRSRASAPGF